MISDKKCIPCQGGVPPLNKDEINNFIKELDSNCKPILSESSIEPLSNIEIFQFHRSLNLDKNWFSSVILCLRSSSSLNIGMTISIEVFIINGS